MRYILTAVLLVVPTFLFAQPPADPAPDIGALLGEPGAAASEAPQAAEAEAPPSAASDEPAAETPEGKSSGSSGSGEANPEEVGEEGPAEKGGVEESAADPDLIPETPSWREVLDDVLQTGAIGLLLEGGFFMWPILIMGIVATGVMIERYRSLKMLSTDTAALRGEVADLLRSDRIDEALKKCDQAEGPVPAVLATGVRRFFVLKTLNYDPGRIEEQVVKAMDDYSVHIVAALERHLPVLATVASAAPMLGFLGTVQGMIIAFRDIVAQMGETNVVEAAAAGIQTALLTTCFGLIVGIPAYIAYNYFTSVINRYVLDVEESATELIETVTMQMALAQHEAGETAAAAP
jgi:biopolymer transport protein ExbB